MSTSTAAMDNTSGPKLPQTQGLHSEGLNILEGYYEGCDGGDAAQIKNKLLKLFLAASTSQMWAEVYTDEEIKDIAHTVLQIEDTIDACILMFSPRLAQIEDDRAAFRDELRTRFIHLRKEEE